MGNNGTDILFLPGDDFVEWVYDENATSPNPTPLCPGDASCNNNGGYAVTGTNVGRLIILFGSLLMLIGGLILRSGYRY